MAPAPLDLDGRTPGPSKRIEGLLPLRPFRKPSVGRWLGAAPLAVLSPEGLRRCFPAANPRALATCCVLIDQTLVGGAQATAARTTGVEVRQGDAGDPHVFADVPPVDLLLLCGIFGNVSDDDVRTTVAAAPSMLAPNGTVIWTRGRFGDHDLRPAIRRWFVDAGLAEESFDGDPERYGVGVARAGDRPPPLRSDDDRLFTFTR